jgi:predicted negative regulator of RcsB-dependent stress response
MSAKNTSAVVVGNGRVRGLSRRTLVLIIGTAVILAAVLSGLWLTGVFDRKQSAVTSTTKNTDNKVATSAYADAMNGEYAQAQQSLDAEAAKQGSKADTARIYITQSALAFNANKFDEAKTYATRAEQAYPSDSSAELLGDIAMKQGDKASASKYYKLAIGRLDKSKNNRSYPAQLRTYQEKLQVAGS